MKMQEALHREFYSNKREMGHKMLKAPHSRSKDFYFRLFQETKDNESVVTCPLSDELEELQEAAHEPKSHVILSAPEKGIHIDVHM